MLTVLSTLVLACGGAVLPASAAAAAASSVAGAAVRAATALAPAAPASPAGLTGVKAIASGAQTQYALMTDGTVRAWGNGTRGELGNGTTTDSNVPVQVTGLTSVTAVTTSYHTAYALLQDGTVRTWGYNQLGIGTNYNSVPVQVPGPTGVTSITATESTSYALLQDGTVWDWGASHYGELGNGTTTNSRVPPAQISGLTGVRMITSTGKTTYALLQDGTVRSWGWNYAGQLGNGTTADSNVPVQVTGLTGATSIACTDNTAYALLQDGTVRAWGFNNYGALGIGTYGPGSSVPVQVTGLTGVTGLATASFTAYALMQDGTVRAWGNNSNGGLGGGFIYDGSVPVQVTGLTGVRALAAADNTTYAVMQDGTVRAWGYNPAGQVGNGTTTTSRVPVQVTGLTGVTAVSTTRPMEFTTGALLADGTVRAWGDNKHGQLGNGATTNATTIPVQVGDTSADSTPPVLTSVSLESPTTLRVGDVPQIRWTATDENQVDSMSFWVRAPDRTLIYISSAGSTTTGTTSSGLAAAAPVDGRAWPAGQYQVEAAQFYDLARNLADTRYGNALGTGVDLTTLTFNVTYEPAATAIQTAAANDPYLGSQDSPVTCGQAGGGCYQQYRNGQVRWSPTTGAHSTSGDVYTAWAVHGAETGPLGYPVADLTCGQPGGGCYQDFQGGAIIWSAATFAHASSGPTRTKWGSTGFLTGPMGYPTSDVECGQAGGGCYQDYQGGAIIWSTDTGAHLSTGPIRTKWGSTGFLTGPMGYPASDVQCGQPGGGCYQDYQGGAIIWSPAGGAHLSTGAIRGRWGLSGYLTGPMRYPTTDVQCGQPGGGCYQDYQGGAIIWSPDTGAHLSMGAIRQAWAATGFLTGRLRYPTTEEYSTGTGSTVQDYQGGRITWSPATGAKVG